MSWWDSAYRSGSVNWDPGEYDRHLDDVLNETGLPDRTKDEPRAVDLGCGNGKSLVWLAERGFRCHGVDLSPAAIEQARDLAERSGVGDRCKWIAGSYPGVHRRLPLAGFDLVMERAFLQHLGAERDEAVRLLAELLSPDGFFYSLMIAGDSVPRYWGMGRWNENDMREMLSPWFEVVTSRRTVFTPGERGSMGAILTIARLRS